jgi:ABC-type nitrate/sulfonate/bicarbonate transport system permease component
MSKPNLHKYTAPIITITIILFLWWVLTHFRFINPLFLPRLSSLGKALAGILGTKGIYYDIFQTLYRAIFGLLLSIFFAVPLGIFLGSSRLAYNYLELPFDFFRSIPSSALFPLFIIIFGIGDLSKIGIVFYGCFLILIVNSVYGAKPSKEKIDRINILKSFGATKFQIFRYAVFRDALPQIASGIRICISMSLVLVIVSEMYLGASNGLGKQIYDYYLQYNIPEMYASIIILGVVGFLTNKLFGLVENKFIFWLPK